ncbi:MAG: hypothetical protein ACJATG_001177, partial [Dinoroseobacter sp.]
CAQTAPQIDPIRSDPRLKPQSSTLSPQHVVLPEQRG